MILRDMRVFSATTSDAQSNPALQIPHLIRTPRYYGQLSLSLERALTFSINLTRTPVNADNGHLFLVQSTELISLKVNLPNADTYQLFAVISVDVNFRLFWHQSNYAEDGYV